MATRIFDCKIYNFNIHLLNKDFSVQNMKIIETVNILIEEDLQIYA